MLPKVVPKEYHQVAAGAKSIFLSFCPRPKIFSLLDMMVTNGKNEKANRYLKEAAAEIRHALSDLSDAEFDITTSSNFINYGIEDDCE